MGTFADYLRDEQAAIDARMEAQARSLSDYRRNQQVLESMGQRDQSAPKPGLINRLFGSLGVLSRPGNIVRAGILEALGKPTDELKASSGLDEFMDLVKGRTEVTGAQLNEQLLPGLKKNASDSFLSKAGKTVAGLATDVVTDPLSYVGAPSSISRKAAAETLANVAAKEPFLESLVSASSKGGKLVDELVAATPLERAAEIQRNAARALEEAGNTEAANKLVGTLGAPLDTIENVGSRQVAAQAAADRLSQALYTRGRTGLLKELEAMTGSREAALKMFKSLPEDVRGGFVLANPFTGKPFETAEGKYMRLTQGTGEMLGGLAEPLNTVRQGLGVAGNKFTRNFSGQAGNILADVKSAALKSQLPDVAEKLAVEGTDTGVKAAPRFIDYVSFKKGLLERDIVRQGINAKSAAATKEFLYAGKDFVGAQKEEFDRVVKEAFLSADKAAADVAASTTKTEASEAALAAAKDYRDKFAQLYEEANKAGLDLGNIGDPRDYTPLVLKEGAHKRLARLGSATGEKNTYRMDLGRGSFITYNADEGFAKTIGWVDPKNPGVTYLNPKAANDKLADRAVEAAKAGKSEAEIEAMKAELAKIADDARIFVEDPVALVEKYGNYVANAAASKRFADVLSSTGTVIKDVPQARRLIDEWKTSTFGSALDTLKDETKKVLAERKAAAATKIDELTGAGGAAELDRLEAEHLKMLEDRAKSLDNAAGRAPTLGGKSLYDQAVAEVNAVKAVPVRSTADELTRVSSELRAAEAAGDTAKAGELSSEVARHLEVLDAYAEKYAGTATGDYAKSLSTAHKSLDDAGFDAFDTIITRDKIEGLMEKISILERDTPEMQKAVSDLYSVFSKIRKQLPDEVFDKLPQTQRDLISGEAFTKLRTGLMRNEVEPGAIAQGLVDAGYREVRSKTAKAFTNLYADNSVAEALNTVYNTTKDPSSWDALVTAYIDPLLASWKLAATTGRGPAYVINNIMGGMFNNHIGGVGIDMHLLSLKTVDAVEKQAKLLEKMHPEKTFFDIKRMAEDAVLADLNKQVINGVGVGDIYKKFMELGGFDQTEVSALTQMALRETPEGASAATFDSFSRGNRLKRTYPNAPEGKVEQAVRKVTDITTTNRPQLFMNDMAQKSEAFLRFAAFMDGFAKYGDFDAAMGKVKMLHFDYKDLGPGEQWMRRIIPFYSWTRNNVPLQLRTIVMQPGKIQRFVKGQQALGSMFAAEDGDSWMNGIMPEWVSEKGGVVSKFSSAAGKMGLIPNLPFTNVTDVTSRKGLLGSLTPLAKVPLELMQQRNLETGAPLTESPWMTALTGLSPYVGTGRNLVTAANLPVNKLTGINLPFAEQGKEQQRFASVLGLPALGGFQLAAVSPGAMSAEMSKRTARQYDQIDKVAADLGVDTDWIRAKLEKGVDPATLAMLIQSGSGKTREAMGLPPEENRISQSRRQRALEALASLGQ